MQITVMTAPTPEALARAIEEGGRPSFVSVHCNVDAGPLALGRALAGQGAVIGATSCLGAMTGEGVEDGIAAFVIRDPGGSYGTAARAMEGDPEGAARAAVLAALDHADRAGEKPELVWLAGTPGAEEAVLRGIESVTGPEVPIIGGSAADNSVAGGWCVFDGAGVHGEGVAVAVLFPSGPVSFAYQNGYAPTGITGRVTRAEGRRVHEIDGRPAAEVYGDWTGGAVAVDPEGGEGQPILSASTFWPLGREISDVGGVPYYLLAHPAVGHGTGAIDLFATVAEGEVLTQMAGSADGLASRAGRVAGLAKRAGRMDTADVRGALIIYCGGCMLSVRDRLDEVVAGVKDELGDAPFLGAFTFGEQGPILGQGNRHGNLMISCIVFG